MYDGMDEYCIFHNVQVTKATVQYMQKEIKLATAKVFRLVMHIAAG